MADFNFLYNKLAKKWIISAPRRAQRTNVSKQSEPICPFCIGREDQEEELYRVGGSPHDANWHVRVIANKFPFAPHHEIIIHSPDHHKNFDELPFSQVELLLRTYRERFRANGKKGQVYIFHNKEASAGASLAHPHTQIAVIPKNVLLEIPPLDVSIYQKRTDVLETELFLLFCPQTSEWPDEVWIAPKKQSQVFGSISNDQITDLSFVLARLIQIFDVRHGAEFPFNFYIYPGKNWYLRLIPRIRVLGGFELGTQVSVNTQDPVETFAFLQEHFWRPDIAKIRNEHQADYLRSV